MTTVIKNGTLVTADLTYKADVQQSIRARPMVVEPSLARRTTHPTGGGYDVGDCGVNSVIFSVPGLVDVTWRDDLKAVQLKWHSEYDEGTAVRDAVLAALTYVREHGVTNWLADISTSREGLSDADLAWVTGEDFRSEIRASPLRRFVLIPPLPETGQDTAWLADWERNTLAAFGDHVRAKLESDIGEIRDFFRS